MPNRWIVTRYPSGIGVRGSLVAEALGLEIGSVLVAIARGVGATER